MCASTERCFLSSLSCINAPGAATACAGVDPLPAELEGQLESEVLRAPFFIEAAVILPAHKALLLADTGGLQALGSWVMCGDCCHTVAGLPPYGSACLFKASPLQAHYGYLAVWDACFSEVNGGGCDAPGN